MALDRLVISNFRNIEAADIQFSPSLNFISGTNGSGKTSVLEALSTIGLGRSFRTRKYKNIIRYQQSAFVLFSELDCLGNHHRIGVTRELSGHSAFKLDGKQVSSSIELVNLVPLQVINSDSFTLLSGGPGERRKFLDWLVFHVKHSYQNVWRDYSHCLKQRNALLRSGRIDQAELEVWDVALSEYAEVINQVRSECINDFLVAFNQVRSSMDFLDAGEFSAEYSRGWSTEYDTYSECLKDHLLRDTKLGFTSAGPHKSDVQIRFSGRPVSELFSRGQLKSLIVAMYVTQIELYIKSNPKPCLLLIDDLAAEFDDDNLTRVSLWLSLLEQTQIFVTGVDTSTLIKFWPQKSISKSKLFHVKHGQITEQPMHLE